MNNNNFNKMNKFKPKSCFWEYFKIINDKKMTMLKNFNYTVQFFE